MRELEFLPSWYPTLRRKRRILLIEAWLAIVIIATLGLWMILSARNVMAKETVLTVKQTQLTQSNKELEYLAELKRLQQQMSSQAVLMSRLGPNVPVGRVLETLDEMLPPQMALLDVTVQFPEGMNPAPVRSGPTPIAQPDRMLVVELHGVAPSDVELGTFMMNISKIPNYEGSPKMLLTDVHENGHLMRDFQLSFSIKLNEGEN